MLEGGPGARGTVCHEGVRPTPAGQRESARMGKRLYVGNIPYQTSEAQLRALFEEGGGEVSEVKIVPDRETGRPRGFAFVELASDAQAEAAVGALNGKAFGGRPPPGGEGRGGAPRGG